MVSAYFPLNINAREFINDYKNLLLKLKSNNRQDTKIIIGMDHNLDFLKSNSHEPTQDFPELNLDNHLIPIITRPTRITKSSATLIDNLFVSENIVDCYRSGLLLDDLSDHLPCIVTLEHVDPDTKGYNLVKTRKLDDTKLANIKRELNTHNWNDILDARTCQENYDKFDTILTTMLDSHAPVIMKKQGKKYKSEPWITLGLQKCRKKQKKLYKKFLSNRSAEYELKYKSY